MRKNIFFAMLILVFSLANFAYSQEQSSSVETSNTDVVSFDVSEVKETESEKLIKDIKIEGNKSISSSTILSKIKTRVNQPYYSRVARDDIKRLYETGFFSDVSIDIEEKDGGVGVVIKVVEKAIVDEVILNGNKLLRNDLIKEKIIKTKPNQYLDYNQLKEDVDNLKQEYQKRGYSNAEVNYNVQAVEATNKTKVKFNIIENYRIRIKRVYIKGNENVKTSKIIKAMKTRKARIFHAGFFKEGEFRDDLERIKILYNSEGFPDAIVESRIEYDDEGFMYIYILITEGKKYTVGSVIIAGNKDFSIGQLLGELKEAVPGNTFSDLALQKDVYNLHTFYLDKGYLFAQVKESTSLNPQTSKVDISYNIIENEVVYVERIDIRGNTKTKDKIIRREIRLNPGDKFDGEKLKRSKERLDNLGFFEEVVFDNETGSEPNKENLIVDVKETQTGTFSFGGGYSSVDQFIGFVEVEQKNFDIFNFPYFTGGGQDLVFRSEIGSVIEDFTLSFTEPWLFDHPISFGFDAYKSVHDKETDVGYGYNEERVGGDLRLGKEFSEYIKGNVTYRLEEVTISDVDDTATADLKKETGENVISSMEFNLTRDTRDNIYNPKKGTVLSGSTAIAGGPFGGDKDFIKLFGLCSKYFGFWEKSVIEAKLRSGVLLTFGSTDDIPIYERFYAGGADTIRGYNERKVGPIDSITEDPIGGESIVVGNIEYNYSLIEFLKIAVFFDIGNVWRKVEDIGSGDFKAGTGFGIRVKTPLGPMKLDYGIPFSEEPGEEDKEGKFHFSMSRTF